ncbi:MAG: WD40 repeat domain-containing protein, partial [Planctomycetaceae bacterium]|nr:WD40 repeat domain-containing protein [Planctomycetaceae bacterium]
MSEDSTPAPRPASGPRRSWRRFSLRTLLVLAPLLAVGLGLGFRWWYPRYLERRAVEAIEHLGGTVSTDTLTGKTWVELPGKGITDEELARLVPHLRNLAKLTDLVLVSNKVSDEGLLLLAELSQLKFVYVADTLVTDAGVARLQALRPNLTIDRTTPHGKAMRLAARPIFSHALLRLALAPDKSHILAGSGDGRLQVFDLATNQMVRSVAAHGEWTFAVAIHPSGQSIATAGGDTLIKLWSWPELVEIGRFTGHEDDVHAIGFTPDGRRLVSAGDDLAVRIWDVATCTELHCLAGHNDTIPGLAISKGGELAATASRDATVRLWSIDTGKCVAVLEGHTDDVMAVDFHPSGRELASASYDKSVRIWNLDRVAPTARGVLKGGSDWLFSVAYSLSGD